MQNTDYENETDYGNAADAALINKHFQNFLEEFVIRKEYLPEVTDLVLKAYGVKDKRCIMALMVYAFTAGMNTGVSLALAENETEDAAE